MNSIAETAWLNNKQVRKRARGFPDHVGLAVEFEQPAALPHTDFSVAGAEMYLDAVFPSSSEEFKKGCYEQIKYVKDDT